MVRVAFLARVSVRVEILGLPRTQVDQGFAVGSQRQDHYHYLFVGRVEADLTGQRVVAGEYGWRILLDWC